MLRFRIIRADKRKTLSPRDETMNMRNKTNDAAKNLYDSLFNGKTSSLPKHLQDELDAMERANDEKIAKMTDQERAAEFDRIMGR